MGKTYKENHKPEYKQPIISTGIQRKIKGLQGQQGADKHPEPGEP